MRTTAVTINHLLPDRYRMFDDKKIRLVIFSRNRAMQLDALLRSYYLHCKDPQLAQLAVLYRADSDLHSSQYEAIQIQYPDIWMVQQGDFRTDLLSVLNPFREDSGKSRLSSALRFPGRYLPLDGSLVSRVERRTVGRWYTALLQGFFPRIPSDYLAGFLVDDAVFVREFSLREIGIHLHENREAVGFSLRLGLNTTYCYAMNQAQPVPDHVQIQENIIKYRWPDALFDFGYPLEVSSSIYRLGDILPLAAGLNFRNPNQFEGQLASNAYRLSSRRPELLAYTESVAFCNPVNLVQSVVINRFGERVQYTTDELARMYSNGMRIDVGELSGLTPAACHQEMDFRFQSDGDLS